ncbi:hypothetical protein HDU76_009735 [Blyttiomyces sp. JEL0837]|nr:hypothetical protein HDU76_009735 [Blyttiomyces sp. JEL0837]
MQTPTDIYEFVSLSQDNRKSSVSSINTFTSHASTSSTSGDVNSVYSTPILDPYFFSPDLSLSNSPQQQSSEILELDQNEIDLINSLISETNVGKGNEGNFDFTDMDLDKLLENDRSLSQPSLHPNTQHQFQQNQHIHQQQQQQSNQPIFNPFAYYQTPSPTLLSIPAPIINSTATTPTTPSVPTAFQPHHPQTRTYITTRTEITPTGEIIIHHHHHHFHLVQQRDTQYETTNVTNMNMMQSNHVGNPTNDTMTNLNLTTINNEFNPTATTNFEMIPTNLINANRRGSTESIGSIQFNNNDIEVESASGSSNMADASGSLESQYQCKVCWKRFRYKQDLKRHLRTIHG